LLSLRNTETLSRFKSLLIVKPVVHAVLARPSPVKIGAGALREIGVVAMGDFPVDAPQASSTPVNSSVQIANKGRFKELASLSEIRGGSFRKN
jgi:hypothetical protein